MNKLKKALIIIGSILVTLGLFWLIVGLITPYQVTDENPWRRDKTLISAHRGGANLNPENTQMAFDYVIIETTFTDIVEIDVRLNNASAKDALFTDPIIQIELPDQVKNIDIKSADIIYENELVPAGISVEGNVIKAQLTGTQTEYNDDGIINGSIISSKIFTI